MWMLLTWTSNANILYLAIHIIKEQITILVFGKQESCIHVTKYEHIVPVHICHMKQTHTFNGVSYVTSTNPYLFSSCINFLCLLLLICFVISESIKYFRTVFQLGTSSDSPLATCPQYFHVCLYALLLEMFSISAGKHDPAGQMSKVKYTLPSFNIVTRVRPQTAIKKSEQTRAKPPKLVKANQR